VHFLKGYAGRKRLSLPKGPEVSMVRQPVQTELNSAPVTLRATSPNLQKTGKIKAERLAGIPPGVLQEFFRSDLVRRFQG